MSKKLIALCACPMGLAHTFMAAQALEEAAVEAGYEVKIETQGADGIQNRLTAQDIAEADRRYPNHQESLKGLFYS